MATQEKLLKSLECLRNLTSNDATTDTSNKEKREKIHHCTIITEAMTNSTIKIAPNFGYLLSFSIEVLLQLCNDPESDIRMIADECLNRLIRAMSDCNISKIQIELHKEIKKNGPACSLRGALWRFAELAHHIRPHKGKPYIANLLPCIIKITERTEEMVHETLAGSLPKIMSALGCFATDHDVKLLLKAFLYNVPNSSAVIRRTTTSCILTVCLNCRKPYVFLTYTLNNLLDTLIPVQDGHASHLILGTLGCLRTILPHIKNSDEDRKIKGSFGVRREISETSIIADRLSQIYELCLYYLLDHDHNIVNASLETLNALLQNAPADFITSLMNPDGFGASKISLGGKLKQRRSPSDSQLSSLSGAVEDHLETELVDSLRPDIERWIDESKLSVLNVTYARTTAEIDVGEQGSAIITAGEGGGGVASDEYFACRAPVLSSETSSETSHTDDKSTLTTNTDFIHSDVDIGDFHRNGASLLYCARLIVKLFLLRGHPGVLVPDKSVRVSVKSLSLSCLATIIRIYPRAFTQYLDRTHTKQMKADKQQISDVLLFKDHSDPQLRGNVRNVVGNYVKAILERSSGDWTIEDEQIFRLGDLIEIIRDGLEDKSSNCARQSLQCVGVCLTSILESHHCKLAVPLLDVLPLIAGNPYWLVKVTLLEVLADIRYITVHHVNGTNRFQDKIVRNVFLELLRDENQKVRSACASNFVRVVPYLYYPRNVPNEGTVVRRAKYYQDLCPSDRQELETSTGGRRQIVERAPYSFNQLGKRPERAVEEALSRIVSELSKRLLTFRSKHFLHGCIETLRSLSDVYPPAIYFVAWGCSDHPPTTTGLFAVCVDLLCNGVMVYDTNFHSNLLKFTGNLFSGIAVKNLKPKTDFSTLEDTNRPWDMFGDENLSGLTQLFFHHTLKLLNVFHHVIEEIVPVQPHHKPVLSGLPTAAVALSPIKRRRSDVGGEKVLMASVAAASSSGRNPDKEDHHKGEKHENVKVTTAAGHFTNAPHYIKMYDSLKTAHANYKMTLDPDASRKFSRLLKATLYVLSQLLELATLSECGRISEEILNYCRCTFNLEPSTTVGCVQQLLKSLFGTNLTCGGSDPLQDTISTPIQGDGSFYQSVFQEPYGHMVAACLDSINNSGKSSRGSGNEGGNNDDLVMGYLRRRDYKKSTTMATLPRGADKILANYIRLFESMVIKSLKQYTVTSDVKLQCNVLRLLCQLVQLRVNYCLLDSEQIFIGFVLKQFEYIEEGQIPFADELIPRIFDFLVHLSYGKQHSKSIIGIPKIIQLCDGLMASGQPPQTHCVPALRPVVEDIFLFRSNRTNNAQDAGELETTREVLLAMLLRLLEYREVMDLLAAVLDESKHYCGDNSDRWLRWSRQVADVLLPALKQNKISTIDPIELGSFRRLVFALNPSVFKPLNDLLLIIFDDPPVPETSMARVNSWLGKVHTLLMVTSRTKEELLLLKISEIRADLRPCSVFRNVLAVTDPLNVTSTAEYFLGAVPEVIFVRYIFRVLHIVAGRCLETVGLEECPFLVRQFSGFLMFCFYTFQSGSRCKIALAAVKLTNNENAGGEPLPIGEINEIVLKLAPVFPVLAFHWCCLLALLNYNDRKFWSAAMRITSNYGIVDQLKDVQASHTNHCLNLEVVRYGATIAFCDYLNENMRDGEELSWFLVNNTELLVRLCDEEPVREFLSAIDRDSAASGLLVQAIATKCLPISDVTLEMKVLRTVENVHASQVGALLRLLVPKMLDRRRLAFSRTVANLASRKIELLLTMPAEEVRRQLSSEDLTSIMDSLVENGLVRKHEALVSLLNKLASQHHDLSPLEFVDQRRTVNPHRIRELRIDKAWYVLQVKSKSQRRAANDKTRPELAELLSCLDTRDLLDNIMSDKGFDRSILNDCIAWSGDQKIVQDEPCCLLKASVSILLKDVADLRRSVPKQHQVYMVLDRLETSAEAKYTSRLTGMFSDDSFRLYLRDLMRSVTRYVEHLHLFQFSKTKEDHDDDLEDESVVRFGLMCLEYIVYLTTSGSSGVNDVDVALNCAEAILRNVRLYAILVRDDAHASWTCSAVNAVYRLVSHLLTIGNVGAPLPIVPEHNPVQPETAVARHACHQLSVLIVWLERTQTSIPTLIPKFLLAPIKSLIVCLSRLPVVNSYVLIPPGAWRNGFHAELSGKYGTQAPPLPTEYLREVDVLEEFVFRTNLLGWTSRQQFEETWVCLLGVLNSNPTEDSTPDEETNAIVHVTALAVQAITSLLLQTLATPIPGNTVVSRHLHVSRDPPIDLPSVDKLRRLQAKLARKFNRGRRNSSVLVDVFVKPNLERLDDDSHYSLGQLSVEYLLVATGAAESTVDDNVESRGAARTFAAHQKVLEESGLDLNSCMQFLVDLYSQWIKAQNTPPRILLEVIKSVVVISDLFTDKSQFTWMLETFLDVSRTHTIEDEIVHQHLVAGVCKAAAVLTPDAETYEAVKKLTVHSLKSGFVPSKMAALHGILYLLQGGFLGNTRIGGLSEEIQSLLPVVVDYVQAQIGLTSQSVEHGLLVWATAFYLIENVDGVHFGPDFVSSVIRAAITYVSSHQVHSVQVAVLKGLERLVIKGSIPANISEQLIKFSLENMKSAHPIVAMPAVQALLTCIYTDSAEQLQNRQGLTDSAQSNPDTMVQTIEKISAIFDRIKRGFPFEVEILCSVLPDILNDFFPPADVLNKVLGEFLSPQQPHPKLLSRVVFRVFERAIEQSQLPLLQDWVVFSLSNFTQSFPMGVATWCLTCFFMSASRNRWLRALFPYVQSRAGRYEYEDRKMLCVAGTDFYRNLTSEKQRQAFVGTFGKVREVSDAPFADLLASL